MDALPFGRPIAFPPANVQIPEAYLPVTVGIPKECASGERRVALVPTLLDALKKRNVSVLIEQGAGESAGFPDTLYEIRGARTVSRDQAFEADIVLQVRAFPANPSATADLPRYRKDQVVIGFCDPLSSKDACHEFAPTGATLLAMELMPRITRAQAMDALSSMATIAGYKAVLMAADRLPRMFPLLMTAAGTVTPAKVFILGAGVAGLQAIATARRLGAVVSAYDVRPAVREQVESVGAKFVQMELDAASSEDKGGYAKAMGEEFYRRQRELLTSVLAEMDVAITTAAIPGQKAPILITREMVEVMPKGSVIVDLAAERGGNCEVTEPGHVVVHEGVTVFGPLNVPSEVAYHASQMYAKNLTNFLQLLLTKEGELQLNFDDEIVRETCVARGGSVVHPRVKINQEQPA